MQANVQKYNSENGIITVNFIDYDQGVGRNRKRESRLEYMRQYNKQKTIRLRQERENRKLQERQTK